MLKEAVLKRKKRKTRGKGKRDRLEWGLFSKTNPKKVLKWFGPDKPNKKEIAKEEARIHAFSSMNHRGSSAGTIRRLLPLYEFLSKNNQLKEAGIIALLIKEAASDPVATNKTKREEFEANTWSPKDKDLLIYENTLWSQMFSDIYNAHFEKEKRKISTKFPDYEESKVEELAVQKVMSHVDKAVDKAVSGSQSFLEQMKDMGLAEGDKIISPGSGFANEQVVAPEYSWEGRDVQKNLVNLSNQRNQQMGLDSQNKEWSILQKMDSGKLALESSDNEISLDDFINKFEVKGAKALYAKHACGGITDGSLFNAVRENIPKILVATCCAHRLTDVSWRVLEPRNSSGDKLSFEEYEKIAKMSKNMQKIDGLRAHRQIDQWRKEFLERNGYTVTSGETSYGPYIKAVKS